MEKETNGGNKTDPHRNVINNVRLNVRLMDFDVMVSETC